VRPRQLIASSILALALAAGLYYGLKAAPVKAGLIAAPAGAYAGPRVTVSYMIWGQENEVRQERAKLVHFVEENPDIQIDLIQTGGTQYQVKLATMLAGGVAPDVFMVHESMFPTLALNKLIMPLDDLVAEDPDVDLDEFFPRVVEECRYRGVLYKLPMGFNTVVFYYNKDMFDAAGVAYPSDEWTWQDMLRMARRLTRRDSSGRATQYGVMGVGPWLTDVMMMWQNGAELFDGEGRLVIGKPAYARANAQALQFCADLQLTDKVQPTEAAIETLPANPFVAGRVAISADGTWLNNQLRGHQDFRWDIAPPPREKERATLVFGGSPVINARTPRLPQAWRLLKAMAGDWWQERIAHEARSLPGKRSVARDLRIAGIPEGVHVQKAFDAIAYARSQPIGPDISEWMERPISDLRDEALLGTYSGSEIREQLEDMQRQYDRHCPYCSALH
jgi:multiple sugar transport system substrate-binding protein